MQRWQLLRLRTLGIIILGSLVLSCGLASWIVVGPTNPLSFTLTHKVNAGYRVSDIAISPDGQLLASAKVPRRFYYGSGDTIASTGETQSIELRRVSNGQLVRTLVGHTGFILSVAFSPDGTFLASSSADKTVKIWNARDGDLLTTLPFSPGKARSLAWNPDGTTLVVSNEVTIMVWQVQDWKVRTILRAVGWQTEFSPQGKLLAAVDKNVITVWRSQDWQRVATLDTGGRRFAWSPDEQFIVVPGIIQSNGGAQEIGVWRAQDGQKVALLKGHTGQIFSLAWSPDGRTIASGSGELFAMSAARGDKTIRLWRTSDWQQVRSFRAHGDVITDIIFTPDGRQRISSSIDRTIRWWNLH